MQDNVLTELGINATALDKEARDRITVYIGKRLIKIAKRTNWRCLLTEGQINTVAGQRTYDLAADCNTDQGLVYARNQTALADLEFLPDDLWRDRVKYQSTGSPYYYRLYGRSSGNLPRIQLDPVPTGVETITYEYYRIPSKPTLPTDTVPFSESLLEQGALADYLKFDESPAHGAEEDLFEQMLRDEIARNSDYKQGLRMGIPGAVTPMSKYPTRVQVD